MNAAIVAFLLCMIVGGVAGYFFSKLWNRWFP